MPYAKAPKDNHAAAASTKESRSQAAADHKAGTAPLSGADVTSTAPLLPPVRELRSQGPLHMHAHTHKHAVLPWSLPPFLCLSSSSLKWRSF